MIKIETSKSDSPLFGKSKWWGQPDMPDELDYPEVSVVDDDGEEYLDPLTFVCQLRCDELAPFDSQGLLPHHGMLYFFAALDYFFGDIDTPASPGMGLWDQKYYRVLYSPSCDNLHTHKILFEDGTPFGLPAETITFSYCDNADNGIRLICKPYLEEVCEEFPDKLSLLQIDEDDRWGLRFYDCGMVNFLVSREQLQNRQWDKVLCHLYSF